MRLLVAIAVIAWVTPPPMNILREGSYWKCLSDNCEAAGCSVLSDQRTKSKIKQNSVLRNLKLLKSRTWEHTAVRHILYYRFTNKAFKGILM